MVLNKVILLRLSFNIYAFIGGPPAWQIKLANPDNALQIIDSITETGFSDFCLLFILLAAQLTATKPTIILTMVTLNRPKQSAPITTPKNEPNRRRGNNTASLFGQNTLIFRASINNNIGSSNAAAACGEITILIRGTAITPAPPAKPDLDTPIIYTTKMARHQNKSDSSIKIISF